MAKDRFDWSIARSVGVTMTTKLGELAEGELVSVHFPGKAHEQIGSVVETGCTFQQEEEKDDFESQVMEVSVVRRDGIRVHFPVDNYTVTVPPETVKKMGDEEGSKEVSAAAAALASSSPQQTGRRVMRSRRSVVTPSPNLAKGKKASRTNNTSKKNKEDMKPAAKRKRAETEPDPSASSESESSSDSEEIGMSEKVEESKVELKVAKKKSAASQRRSKVTKSRQFQHEENEKDTNEDVDFKMICLPVAVPSSTKKAASSRKSGKTKEPPLIVLADDSEAEEAAPNDVLAAEEDSDAEDRPYQVEYSVSSRSTCRRCDSIITKGELRISHVPLFRGKPGYRVYRHLSCAVFTEEIKQVTDVGGWRQLTKSGLEKLKERIQESSRERDEENQELQPDELVQQAFAGELRPLPSGLSANLLPFQREGFSWMLQQENMDGNVRGGILVRTQ